MKVYKKTWVLVLVFNVRCTVIFKNKLAIVGGQNRVGWAKGWSTCTDNMLNSCFIKTYLYNYKVLQLYLEF